VVYSIANSCNENSCKLSEGDGGWVKSMVDMAMRSSNRPHMTIVLAMSADGKLADTARSPARFGSAADKAHLETQLAQADAVLFGAGTLRAYGTTLRITQPDLLMQRQQQGKPPQPTHIVCSQSAQIDPAYPFFRQPVPRWLLTTPAQATRWRDTPEFDHVLAVAQSDDGLDWLAALHQMYEAGLQRIAVTGGGELVASLFAVDCIDEAWITICPLILGGSDAPTLADGSGFLAATAPSLELLSVQTIANEVFLHYRLQRQENSINLIKGEMKHD
jgi:5-amino-6-(5-phosphoribosylamino)uracil reductase